MKALLLSDGYIAIELVQKCKFLFLFRRIYIWRNHRGLSDKGKCLANGAHKAKQSSLFDTNLVSPELPGLIWSLDDQCRMRYGPNATFCRVHTKI